MSIGNSPSDDRPSVGRALAQARLDSGLTVDEVSTVTRVRVPIVQAIEQDDFSRCGGDVYARGHIRSFARAVGLDPEPLVDQYAAEHGTATATVTVPPVYQADRGKIRSTEPRRPNWTAAMIAAIVAVIGFVGYTAFSGSGGDGKPTAGATTPTAGRTTPSHTPQSNGGVPKAPQPTNSAIAAAPPGKVTVKVTAAGGISWIQATDSNGKQLYQDSLRKGQSMTWTDDKKIKLVIGNAGAVQMFVNGKDLGPAGNDGQVVRLTYTPGDPTQG